MSSAIGTSDYPSQYFQQLSTDFSASRAGQKLAGIAGNQSLALLLDDPTVKSSGRLYSRSNLPQAYVHGRRTTFPDDQGRTLQSQGYSSVGSVFNKTFCTCGKSSTEATWGEWDVYGSRPSLGTLRKYKGAKAARTRGAVMWCLSEECIEKSLKIWNENKAMLWSNNKIKYGSESVDDLDHLHFGTIHTPLYTFPTDTSLGQSSGLNPLMILWSWVPYEDERETQVMPSSDLDRRPPLINGSRNFASIVPLEDGQVRALSQWAQSQSSAGGPGVELALFHPNVTYDYRTQPEPEEPHTLLLTYKYPINDDDQTAIEGSSANAPPAISHPSSS